jgi:hypothetical protein
VHYCQAIPSFSGTVADVGENRFRSRSLFDDGGSGGVCDRPLVGMNRHRSESQSREGWMPVPQETNYIKFFRIINSTIKSIQEENIISLHFCKYSV